jgi:anti-sigma B factor antagonist
MFSTDLSTSSCDGHAVVALHGELDIMDAAEVAAALTAVTAREPQIIVDLAGLEFIDSSGVAALAHGRRQARQAGGYLILAAPRRDVMRVLAITRLADAFSVYATVEEAADGTQRSPGAGGSAPGQPRKTRWPRAVAWSRARALRSPAP